MEDEVYKRARVAAALLDTSALVEAYLERLASEETEVERLKRQERKIRDQITNFSAAGRLSRDEVHDCS